ncbi:MAG: GNAT family N-acetyltransferase [Alphaproteobacteria bacterium]|nr:GNAT family N-acetyltransferase [Alphaproteobacteria bacterium]
MDDHNYFIQHTLKDKHRTQLLSLFKEHFWLKTRTLKDIEVMEKTCLILALIERDTDNLVGFTRVLTDQVKYAYIHDVLVKTELQGKGLGRLLIETAINHPTLREIVCFELLCLPDKLPFYKKFNFDENPDMLALRFDRRKFVTSHEEAKHQSV